MPRPPEIFSGGVFVASPHPLLLLPFLKHHVRITHRQVPVQSLPKFLGRIQACVGLGFVLGPMTMTILHRLLRVSNGDTFYAAALFPLAALLYTVFRVSETKVGEVGVTAEVPEVVPLRAEIQSRFVPQERGARPPTAAERAAGTLQTEGLRQQGRYTRREHQSKRFISQGEEDWMGPASEEIAEVVDGDEDGGSSGDGDLTMFDAPPVEGGIGSGLRDDKGDVLEETEALKRMRTVEMMETVDAARVKEADAIPRAVMLLVGNGFLLMYAFSIETIYAMFLKVSNALLYVFVVSFGFCIGISLKFDRVPKGLVSTMLMCLWFGVDSSYFL